MFSVPCESFITIKFQVCVCVAWPLLTVGANLSFDHQRKQYFSQTLWHTRVKLLWTPLPHQNEDVSSWRPGPFLPSPSLLCQPFWNNYASWPWPCFQEYPPLIFPSTDFLGLLGTLWAKHPSTALCSLMLMCRNGVHKLDDPQGQQRTAYIGEDDISEAKKLDIFLFLNFPTLIRLFRITGRSTRVECGHPWKP